MAKSPKGREFMPVRTRLKDLRKRKKLSRMDLVRNANLSYQTVQKWETMPLKELDTLVLHRLLTYLDCTYEELIYEVGEES